MSNEIEEKIKQIQLIEQNLQVLSQQKQQFQTQLIETESALKELGNTDQAFKIIGNLMVLSEKENLKKEVEDKKEMLELKIQSFEKQENSLKERFKKIQQEVMSSMEKGSKKDGKAKNE